MLSLAFIRIICVVVLGALCVAAQTPPPSAQPANGSGVITGKVVNESGQPLPNATVSVRAAGSSSEGATVVTDRDGSFQASGLEQSASYYVIASLPAYTNPQPEPGIQMRRYRVGDSVTLTLIKGGVITGMVMNAAGDPLAGIRVRAQMVSKARTERRLVPGQSWDRETDDRGVYRIYGLPPGSYVVLAGGAGNQWSSSSIDPYDTDVPTYAPSATRDTATEVSVRAGEETMGIDIRYRNEQGHFVSGLVGGTGEGFNVSLTSPEDGTVQGNSSINPEMNGRSFSFVGIADGEYNLAAYTYSQNREYGISEIKRIRVRGADVTGIELTARPLASVAGRVVLDETKVPECVGKSRPPFAEMTVGGWHNDTEPAKEIPPEIWSAGVPVKPDAQGNFLLRNLAPGEYYFNTRFTTKYWHVGSIQFAPPDTSTTKKPIDATRVWTKLKFGEERQGLTVTLLQGGASFSAQLVPGEGGQVSPRTYVFLAPVERERSENPLSYHGTLVGPGGKFTMNNIAPGRYWIFTQALPEDAPFTRIRYPHETEIRAQLRREAEAAKTEIELKPCQDVTDFKLPVNR